MSMIRYHLLNDEKRKIWFRRSSCRGALVLIWEVLTRLCTVTGGRTSSSSDMMAGSLRSDPRVVRHGMFFL